MSRQPRLRYNIEVLASKGGVRMEPFIWNRGEPLRPGSADEALVLAVEQQHAHLSYNGRFIVKGLDLRESHGVVFMWVRETDFRRACVVRKVVV